MHTALTYELLAEEQVLDPLSREQWLTLRKLITEMILATDMARHFEIVDNFRQKYAGRTLPFPKFEDRLALFRMCVKCADIAHAGKTEALHEKWTMQVVQEFFHQGDLERQQQLPISPFCDRLTADLPKDQKGFIQGVVKPLFLATNAVIQSTIIEVTIINQLDVNIEHWKRKAERKKRCSVAPSHPDSEAPLVRAVTKVMATEEGR